MTLAVHLHHVPDDEALALLRAQLDPAVALTMGEAPPDPATYEILVSGRPGAELIGASPHLRAVIVPWAGLPTATRELLQAHPGIAVHNLHHNATPVAEMALALLLAAAKHLLPFDRKLREDDWRPRYAPTPALLLEGKTTLILGYGAIGQRLGALCAALGMRVVAVRRDPAPAPHADAVHSSADLPSLLPQADVLLVTLPLTPATEGLIDAAALARLPPGAILVNVGRGPVVDEAALYDALRSGHLGGAGLDVWWNYPPDSESRADTPPADHPFHELENVVFSPHRAGTTRDTDALRMTHLARLLNAAARGAPMPNRVDLTRGY